MDYIEKQRQRKIKIAEVLEEFAEAKDKENQKLMKTTMRETNNSDRQFITTFTG